MTTAPDHFHMILNKGDPHYIDLPGLSVLIGGMWIANISYWGFNQYIIQRALAAKSLDEAQRGVIFAAFLKLLMPLIIVVPGIAAVTLAPGLPKPDEAYPTMMRLLPPGLLGLVFAALIAAIVASTASKINSIATIFTLDLYAKFRGDRTRAEDDSGDKREERHLVLVGRIAAVYGDRHRDPDRTAAGRRLRTGVPVHPGIHRLLHAGITVIFLLGLFWKRANEAGAIVAAVTSVLLSTIMKYTLPATALPKGANDYLTPFMNRMGVVFLVSCSLPSSSRWRRRSGPTSTRSTPPTSATAPAPDSISARSRSC